MKATPIAEFLARKAGDAPRARAEVAANPFAPRKLGAVNDDGEPEFRRSGLVAAMAKRAPENPPLVRPMPASFAPRREPPPRPPAPSQEPPDDFEARLAEAYHRGVQEGLDAAKSEAATARALERAEWQKRAVVERLDFQMNEYARLSEALNAGFAELERRIAEAAARLLQPLIEETLAREIVAELAENVARLTRAGGIGLLKARGPEPLLSALKAKIGALAVEVEFIADDGVELVVSAQSTEIGSQLGAWRRLLEEIVGGGQDHG